MERVDPLPNSTNSGDRPTVVFAGGGTGGHLFPGIAVAEALERRGVSARCLFIGSTRSVERQIVSENGFEHVALPVESSSLLWQSPVRFANRMWKSAQVARRLLPECKAAIVVGLGGFASVPVVWAARQCGIPIILLEQNAVPGRATSWLSRRAELTCLGFAEAGHRLPARCRHLVTGNPVLSKIAAPGRLGSNGRTRTGPSWFWEAAKARRRSTRHSCRASRGGRRSSPAGRLCIKRVGATSRRCEHGTHRSNRKSISPRFSMTWLPTTGMPVWRSPGPEHSRCRNWPAPAYRPILVPYRKAVRNHQRLNAYAFEHVGAARIVRQSVDPAVTCRRLEEELSQLLPNDGLRGRMARAIRSLARPEAASLVAEQVCQFLSGENRVNKEFRRGDK